MAVTSAELRAVPDATETFDSLDPATGEVVGTHPVDGPEQVDAAVALAREATEFWQGLGWEGRRERLLRWKGIVARRLDELAHLVHRENGKPHPDATLEIVLAIDHIDWAAKHAKKVLGPQRVPAGLLMLNQAASVEYPALGVVGIIGPWNYPVFTPMGSIAYALAAGNTIVFKPSEHTPGIGHWLARRFAEAVPEAPVFTVVTGMGETGAALCKADIDKLAFTGSARTGRKVMAACAENLTPVLMECGGKDALIVAGDADVEAAADAAVWGGMSNAGQTCIGTERVYVVDEVYDEFVGAVKRRACELGAGDHQGASFGPITMPSQLEIITRHIKDALDRGGRAVVGGMESIRAPYVDPVVLVDVPEDADAVQEETFGPTLVVTRVRDADEAVEKANASAYGLASAVFSKRHGMEIARRLRAGMTSVNDIISFAAVPSLPFGGVGESGFGRIHGPDGLKEFSRAHAITRKRFGLPVQLTSFTRPDGLTDVLSKVIGLVHGRD
jgi:acyl-CoA reductase-like NAD-dependent aldehyde dehydrogenase